MSGFAVIHRTLLGHPVFRNDAEAMAFAWMVIKASWRDTRVRYKERTLSLARGQLSVSQRDMANALDRDKAWIERLWKRLKNEAMIEVGNEAGVAVITICNYEKYQSLQKNSEAVNEAAAEAGARQGQGTEQQDKPDNQLTSSEAKASSQPALKQAKASLPTWIPADAWDGFEEMRRRIRKPMTDRARQGIVSKLEKLKRDGYPPGEVLDQSTMNSWSGVFELKDRKNGSGNRSSAGNQYRDGFRDPVLDDIAFGTRA